MITSNSTKKDLIQKLLDSKAITLDDAFMLLEEQPEKKFIQAPYYVQPYIVPTPPPIYPPYGIPWGGTPIYAQPWSGTISVGTAGTLTTNLVADNPSWNGPTTCSYISVYPAGTTVSNCN